MNKIFYLFIGISLMFINLTVYSQQINELKDKKKAIEKEIEAISDLISKTENESKSSLNNVILTKRKIELKNNLIKQIDNESDLISNQIDFRKRRIDSLRVQIKIIKNDYKKLVVYSQKTKDKNIFFLLVLSSKDFNQAYKRIKFYQQVLKYKYQIADRYDHTINSINDENKKLTNNITELTRKQNEKTYELDELKKAEKGYVIKISSLSKKKKELIAGLEAQKRITKKINEEIKRLIDEEAKRESENLLKTNKNSQLVLSNNFKDNIGKFNYPVSNGIITGNYGETFHPILKEIKIKNNGIDITLSQKSDIFSIYKGEVRKIFKIPSSGLAVIIRHGSYLSVYTNLTKVNVNVGQIIISYQKIGEINLQKGEETAILHFELWNENKSENPSKWFKSN